MSDDEDIVVDADVDQKHEDGGAYNRGPPLKPESVSYFRSMLQRLSEPFDDPEGMVCALYDENTDRKSVV